MDLTKFQEDLHIAMENASSTHRATLSADNDAFERLIKGVVEVVNIAAAEATKVGDSDNVNFKVSLNRPTIEPGKGYKVQVEMRKFSDSLTLTIGWKTPEEGVNPYIKLPTKYHVYVNSFLHDPKALTSSDGLSFAVYTEASKLAEGVANVITNFYNQ
jgi:hypothetical protein